MKKIVINSTFKKNYKKIENKYKRKLETYIKILAGGETMPSQSRDHSLQGRMQGMRAFKLDNNLRVVYKRTPDTIYLLDIGTHEVYEAIRESLLYKED